MKYILILFFLINYTPSLGQQTAKEVIEKTEDKMRGNTSVSGLVIRTIRPTWTREMRVKAWLKGSQFSMILVLAPMRDNGIVFLKRKNEVWNWMPSIEKTIKLPPSMMSQSWMGTDFSNDDLVKESSLVTDYIHSFTGDTVINGRFCYKINMIPNETAAVVWGRLLVCVDKERLVQLHVRFYDENNELINTMNGYDVKLMDGRLIPTRFEMIPANKKNQKTEMIYEYIYFNKPIEDGFFSTEKMKYLSEK